MTKKQERIILALMGINALVFVFIFLSVAWNYRLAADDFHHVAIVRELGIWDAMVFYYQNWNTRWSSILVTNTFLAFGDNKLVLFLFHTISLLLGFTAFFSIIRSLVKTLRIPLTHSDTIIAAIYLLLVAFYCSFSKEDSWFWITVNPMYLWGAFAALLGGSLLIQSWHTPTRLFLVALLFLYAGGASESDAICALVVLLYIGIQTRRNTSKWLDRNALHIATIFCMIGFGISMTGEGIQIRREHLPHYPISERLLVGMWNYVKFNLMEIPLVLPIAIIGVTPIGFWGRKHLRFQLMSIKDVVWANRKLWLLADLMVAILAISIGYVMSEMGPQRTWLPLTFLVLTVSTALAYQLGSWVYIHSRGKLFQLVCASQFLLIIFQVYSGYNQVTETSAYAAAVDERMETIAANHKTKDILELEPLPRSGWLFSSEISSDPSHFTNQHLQQYFQTECVLVTASGVNSEQ